MKTSLSAAIMITVMISLSACSLPKNELAVKADPAPVIGTSPAKADPPKAIPPKVSPPPKVNKPPQPAAGGTDDIQAVADPESDTVLINKQHMLPEGYLPAELVYPNVKFTFNEKIEKRMLRKEAADALEDLFSAASKDGLPLAGVSAYRSHERQKTLFEAYVRKDGEKKARTYSAYPGTSEHETGLAIDVTGADGKCSATDCFAGTPEAKWLAKHAHEYGFIIRYPEGKDSITGYKYEPWHLRYVGLKPAADIYDQDITLEEYVSAIEVSGKVH
ncbi:D-alanyl-D-alanine carboxypeptidase family protein [Paenibacillus solisilvae]|uniref:D-alanyl-D-alanine carboxypeptidase family protein n=1 Tax=Paenibacillus solisilvae TaxID=2486751 RepID=A0ABW0VSX7_9BACL